MGQKFNEISDTIKVFIEKQKMFFVATAAPDGRVNLSPKGLDSFRIIDKNRVVWLNATGSGNETSAHILEHPRMTIMFASFEGSPMILRLYGEAIAIHPRDRLWPEVISLFPAIPGTRQIFDLKIDLVQTSCGMAVPYYDFVKPRDQLNQWAQKKGDHGIKEYWKENNQNSIDGHATGILDI